MGGCKTLQDQWALEEQGLTNLLESLFRLNNTAVYTDLFVYSLRCRAIEVQMRSIGPEESPIWGWKRAPGHFPA